MKKLLTLVLALSMVFTMFACGEKAPTSWEVALVTDIGMIDDQSFNQAAWEGVKSYCDANDITYKYYQPNDNTAAARMEQIDGAVASGAKIVVCPGYLFNDVVLDAQDKYPEIKFVILDGAPEDAKHVQRIEPNTLSIFFAEQEAGYLAGYAAVKDGYTKLGFLGGMAVPAVVRFGYGYIAGADDAAKELGLTDVEVNYGYTGVFVPTPDIQTKAAAWYKGGTEVIFTCGGGIFSSVVAAADEASGKIIGVDSDQNHLSETFITSAMKNLTIATERALADFYAGTFEGGTSITLSAKDGAVGLPMETSRFETFDQAAYDVVFEAIKAGSIELPTDADAKTAADLKVEAIKVTVVE